jgi:ubiquinone biosynthesis protein
MRSILTVLVRNELGYIVDELKLKGILNLRHQVSSSKFKQSPEALRPKRVLQVFEELDGTFLKLGQLLALRPDLITQEYCDELRKLQDNTRPFSGKEARKIIEQELKKPIGKIFSVFDETPIASASIGQVHLAALKDGTRVVVKVQKPGIEETFRSDIRLLRKLASLIEKRYHPKLFDPKKIVEEFEKYTEHELSYILEAKNIDKFHQIYKDHEHIQVPAVFWDYTTTKILVMEHISGRRLTEAEHLTPAKKRMIVTNIVDAALEQVFIHGVFHADPHPGNFILKRNDQLGMLDFGIVGRLDDSMRSNVGRLFTALVNGDTEGISRSMLRLGIAGDGFDMRLFKEEITETLGMYYNVSIKYLNVSEVLTKILNIARKHHLKLPSDFVLLIKAIITLESFARYYDPKFNFIEHSRPFAAKLARQKYNPKYITKQLQDKSERVLDFVEGIPDQSFEMMGRLRRTEKDLKSLDSHVTVLTSELDKSSNRISLGMIVAGLLIASTLLLQYKELTLFGMSAFSFIGFSMTFVMLLFLCISMLRERTAD